MAIEVKCPQGHRLSCPDDRAGKQGKCPKCGTTFLVPKPNGQPQSLDAGSSSDSSVSQVMEFPDLAGNVGNAAPAADSPAGDETIVFLCPNGHKLNGPLRLQGKLGKCPHCQATFQIPIYDDEETVQDESAAPESTEPEESGEEADAGDEPIIQIESPSSTPTVDEDVIDIQIDDDRPDNAPVAADVFFDPAAASTEAGYPFSDEAGDSHPLARLFFTLWQERDHGGIVEIHLADQVVLLPDWWAIDLSSQSHSVFALQTPDGSYVIEAVPWDSIKRITVRNITELPEAVFQ